MRHWGFDRITATTGAICACALLVIAVAASTRVKQQDRQQELISARDTYAQEALQWQATASSWQATAEALQAEQEAEQEAAEAQAARETTDAISAEYAGVFEVTANCCEAGCSMCGGTGTTASGAPQTAGITAGANFDALPAGTWVYIEGVGIRQVQDTGPGCPANHIDVAVTTHAEALAWPLQGEHRVWIIRTPEGVTPG